MGFKIPKISRKCGEEKFKFVFYIKQWSCDEFELKFWSSFLNHGIKNHILEKNNCFKLLHVKKNEKRL